MTRRAWPLRQLAQQLLSVAIVVEADRSLAPGVWPGGRHNDKIDRAVLAKSHRLQLAYGFEPQIRRATPTASPRRPHVRSIPTLCFIISRRNPL